MICHWNPSCFYFATQFTCPSPQNLPMGVDIIAPSASHLYLSVARISFVYTPLAILCYLICLGNLRARLPSSGTGSMTHACAQQRKCSGRVPLAEMLWCLTWPFFFLWQAAEESVFPLSDILLPEGFYGKQSLSVWHVNNHLLNTWIRAWNRGNERGKRTYRHYRSP